MTTRRSSRVVRRRFDLVTALALLVPLVTIGLLALTRPAHERAVTMPPRQVPLTDMVLSCPAENGSAVAIASADPSASGPVLRDGQAATLSAGKVDQGRHGKAWRITAQDQMAPGLLAMRLRAKPLGAVACPAPQSDVWFAGVGAAAKHTSTLMLSNPDSGPAVVDLTVYGPKGVMDVPALQGLKISGGQSRVIDLATTVPSVSDLTLHAQVTRGRLAMVVRDHLDRLGGGPKAWDWLPAASALAPSTTDWLLGIPLGAGPRSLTLTNPGSSEVSATWSVVSDGSVFTPTSAHDVVIPPESSVSVTLKDQTKVWASQSGADQTRGLRITADLPVVATLRNFPHADLSTTTTASRLTGRAATLLPAATNTVVLAGAGATGTVQISQRSASGQDLGTLRADVSPGHSTSVKLSPKAAVAVLTAPATGVYAAVLSESARGATVLPLTPLVESGLVPGVAPMLP